MFLLNFWCCLWVLFVLWQLVFIIQLLFIFGLLMLMLFQDEVLDYVVVFMVVLQCCLCQCYQLCSLIIVESMFWFVLKFGFSFLGDGVFICVLQVLEIFDELLMDCDLFCFEWWMCCCLVDWQVVKLCVEDVDVLFDMEFVLNIMMILVMVVVLCVLCEGD